MSPRARFAWSWAGADVIVVVDGFRADDPTMTVSNDAEAVTAYVLAAAKGSHAVPIVYRDSAGRFDEIVHDGERFVGFRTLGCFDLDSALAQLRRRAA